MPPRRSSSDAYPQENVMRLTKRPRDTWVISKSALGISGKMDPCTHGPRLPVEGRGRQGPRHPPLHARDRRRSGAGAEDDRIEHGDGLVTVRQTFQTDSVVFLAGKPYARVSTFALRRRCLPGRSAWKSRLKEPLSTALATRQMAGRPRREFHFARRQPGV